jgi:CheY-like chemotaxis protein
VRTQDQDIHVRRVLVADPDAFVAGYVVATLEDRGLPVAGPFVDAEQALVALTTDPAIRAAVISQVLTAAAPELLDAAERAGVPVLLLLANPAPGGAQTAADTAVLAKPFAGYQVADWASAVLRDEATEDGATVLHLQLAGTDAPMDEAIQL